MSSDSEVQGLAAEVARLERTLARQIAAERRAARATYAVSVMITLVAVGFVLVNYLQLREQWTAAKFERSLESELELLNPTATRELQQLGENLMPVYAAEARRQFDKLGPKIAGTLVRQLEHIGADLEKDIHNRLAATEERIAEQTRGVIFECYPDLEDEAARDEMAASFAELTRDSLAATVTEIDRRFSTDVNELRDCLAEFDLEDDGQPTIELQKRFLSLWLRQLDREIQKL